MKKLFLLLVSSIFVFSSCEDLLSNLLDDYIQAEDNVDDESEGSDNDEENVEPSLPVTEFMSEQDIEDAVNDIYVSLYDYVNILKHIEKSIIIVKDFASITSTNPVYEQGWNAAYETIGKGNLCIRSLERARESFDQQTIDRYLAECFALVGFIYKDLYEHWGNIPIVTPETSLQTILMTSHEDEVRRYAIENLDRALSIYEQGLHTAGTHIPHEAVLLALAEAHGSYEYHKSLEFSTRVIDLNTEKEIVFELTGPSGNIIIYTDEHAKLFYSEFSFILGRMHESGITDFKELLNKWDPSSYGYWSMLKRNKKFIEIIGCPEYMQYLPIPQDILDKNYGLVQNPGY